MRRMWCPAIVAAVFILSKQTTAQTPIPTNKELSFEVASVKPNTSGSGSSRAGSLPDGRGFRATNIPLRLLIQTAFRLRAFQLTGAPAWIATARYDIDARAAENAPTGQAMTMLRALLADRLKLVVHTETRDQPIYALVPARSDGRLGPQMKPSMTDCVPPPPDERGPRASACGMNSNSGNNGGTATGIGQSTEQIAALLGNFVVDRMVVDRTGLAGRYDIELKWAPDTLSTAAGAGGATTPEGASIFTALQEQLGLKLEAQRGPVEFLIIDSIQEPVPN